MRIGLFSRTGSSSSSPASRVRLLAWRQFPRDSRSAARRTARPTRRRRRCRVTTTRAGEDRAEGGFRGARSGREAAPWEDRSRRHPSTLAPQPRNHAEIAERIRGARPNDPPRAPESGSDGARRSTPRAHEDRPRRPPRRPQERGPATSSPRPGPKAPPSTTGARTRVCYAPFPLLRPFTLHCTRKRSAAEGEVSAAEGEAGAAAGNRYIESYVASAGLARRFRRFRRIQAVSSSTRAGARARKARPRWEIAFFSRALICAVVRPAPPGASSAAGTKTGS